MSKAVMLRAAVIAGALMAAVTAGKTYEDGSPWYVWISVAGLAAWCGCKIVTMWTKDAERAMSAQEDRSCPQCHSYVWWSECVYCDGSGYFEVLKDDDEALGQERIEYQCGRCNGMGWRWACPVCDGCS